MLLNRIINYLYSFCTISFFVFVLLSCNPGDNFAPTISTIDPLSGKEGTIVTITGTGFSNDTTENVVLFNGKESVEIILATATQISALVPVGATSGSVSVTVGGKTITGPEFKVFEIEITSISPTGGKVGTEVIITGNDFSLVPDENLVKFNGIVAEVSAATNTSITTSVPEGATTGPVTVTVENQTMESGEFHVILSTVPENFKIAFIGDTGTDSNADAVLNLIKSESAAVVVHAGDLDYLDIPLVFEANINKVLGKNFPYFYCVGNHDEKEWDGADGYQQYQEARFNRLGITWSGQLGVLSSFYYNGMFFVTSAPDEFGIGSEQAGNYIRDELTTDNSIWRVAIWHKNQELMQIGGKEDQAGWNVYEESRKAGAIMATGHEHSYSRTHEMSHFENQVISSTSNTINLQKDNPATAGLDEGRSFAFVSGLGGKGIRDAEGGLDNNPWWASVYHINNGGQHGVLFGEFNYNGDATLARFYFKDIDGTVIDTFFVRSELE
ncbi:MAG: IPT/TIG domain-containing protein [Cyclobacteriaceae bacterium]|nr:IPT/TIG domain-containing protein [Cyclobacteriaceae bacterium]